ncbi:MAG: septal ring lytic transglycosylase RlpA family protein [Bacteroidota bacterium]
MRRRLLIFALVLPSFSLPTLQRVEHGKASFYADKFKGRKTASGEKYTPSKLTAAHKKLPFGTLVKVTNLKNGLSVKVVINDRGPFVPGRIIDLSKAAASKIDMLEDGVVDVELKIIEARK